MSSSGHDSSSQKLLIVFEDREFLAINKFPGIHSAALPKSPNDKTSVAAQLAQQFPGIQHASPKSEDAGLINRLDFETSGLLIAARSREAWIALHSAQKKGEIKKSYLALLEGEFPRQQKKLRIFLGAKGRSAKKMRVYEPTPDGKFRGGVRAQLCESNFEPVLFVPELSLSLVRIEIGLGKRHQIRAQAAHLGHPLVGDLLYGSNMNLQLACGLPHAFLLHAYQLHLPHPCTKTPMVLSAALPYATQAAEAPTNKKGPILALFNKISEVTR